MDDLETVDFNNGTEMSDLIGLKNEKEKLNLIIRAN